MATILVCDDDKDIVEAISIYLEQEGHQILKAYDGQQALLVLQKNEVDLLIIDVMMPKPVSYTHLDVYKRQVLQQLHCMHNLLIDSLSTTSVVGFLGTFQTECRNKVLYF